MSNETEFNESLFNISGEDNFDPESKHLISWDDATWVLTSSFVIFTMQSGFGLLESGMVNVKNEVNIMIKNAVDVIFGGITFWAFGFGLAFGDEPLSNPFCGVGHFFVNADESNMGYIYSWFFFQLSFATTSTTIVSGAMAERTKLISYIVFSTINTVIYCLPAHWVWAKNGFLYNLGMVDVAGGGPVHLVGGVTGLVATVIMGPRIGRFERKEPPPLGCPTNAVLGMFMLWWGWLGFNCGSTFGISGGKWKLAARAAVVTVMSSMSGGAVGFAFSYVRFRKYDVPTLITAILGALVSCTAICAIAHPWEALIIGGLGALMAVSTEPLLVKLKIDDPVGVVPVHFVAGIWGLLSVGLFTDNDTVMGLTQGRKGLFKGGGWYLLGVQALGTVVIVTWTIITSFILLKFLDLTFGLRITMEEELLGADYVEHGIGGEDLETVESEVNKSIQKSSKNCIPECGGCLKFRKQKRKLTVNGIKKLSSRSPSRTSGFRRSRSGKLYIGDKKEKVTNGVLDNDGFSVYNIGASEDDTKQNGGVKQNGIEQSVGVDQIVDPEHRTNWL